MICAIRESLQQMDIVRCWRSSGIVMQGSDVNAEKENW